MSQSILRATGKDESTPQGTRLDIKRVGGCVQISLQCGGDYQAMEVYDRLVAAATRGEVRIDLAIR